LPIHFLHKTVELESQFLLIDAKDKAALELCELFGKFNGQFLPRRMINRFISFALRKWNGRWMVNAFRIFFKIFSLDGEMFISKIENYWQDSQV